MADDVILRVVGALVIAGLIIGITTPIYLIANNMSGNNSSLVDLTDMLTRLTGLAHHISYNFIEEKEIGVNGAHALRLDINLLDGYIEVGRGSVNTIVIEVYSTSHTADGYEASFNVQSGDLHIMVKSPTIKLVVQIPSEMIVKGVNLDMSNGIAKINMAEIKGPISFVIDNGILESELKNIVSNNTLIKMSNGVVKLSLQYSHIDLSEIKIRINDGIFKASIRVPNNTMLKVTPNILNGVVHVSLNGKNITIYEDPGYNDSSSRLDCGITVLNGYAKIDFER